MLTRTARTVNLQKVLKLKIVMKGVHERIFVSPDSGNIHV